MPTLEKACHIFPWPRATASVEGMSEGWEKCSTPVGMRWPWSWQLGKSGKSVQLPSTASPGCHLISPSVWCHLCQGLHSLTTITWKSPCAPRPAAGQQTALAWRPHPLLLITRALQLTALAWGYSELKADGRSSWREVFKNRAGLGSEFPSTRVLQACE